MKSKLSYEVPIVFVAVLALTAFAVSSKPPKDRLSLREAQEIALTTYDGKVESHELEEEKGTWVYSFDLRGKDNQLHEVLVDARTGNVVSHDVETPAQEAQESVEDKQNKNK